MFWSYKIKTEMLFFHDVVWPHFAAQLHLKSETKHEWGSCAWEISENKFSPILLPQ